MMSKTPKMSGCTKCTVATFHALRRMFTTATTSFNSTRTVFQIEA